MYIFISVCYVSCSNCYLQPWYVFIDGIRCRPYGSIFCNHLIDQLKGILRQMRPLYESYYGEKLQICKNYNCKNFPYKPLQQSYEGLYKYFVKLIYSIFVDFPHINSYRLSWILWSILCRVPGDIL